MHPPPRVLPFFVTGHGISRVTVTFDVTQCHTMSRLMSRLTVTLFRFCDFFFHLGPGCTRKKICAFCHTSEKNVTKLTVSSATHVSGQTANKFSRKPRIMIGTRCTCDDFCFFFVKTNATHIGENRKN